MINVPNRIGVRLGQLLTELRGMQSMIEDCSIDSGWNQRAVDNTVTHLEQACTAIADASEDWADIKTVSL